MINHLYIHIPFCPKICPYCSFYKEASDRNKTQAFLDALLAELDRAQQSHPIRPETIFFGGGTPSALSTPQLDFLLTGLRDRLDLSQLSEWTLEMNPATVSKEKAELLKALGVNRISMGVQSFDEELLKTLGRVHSSQQARRSYEILREVGFPDLNLDFIFGIPGQSLAQWESTLAQAAALAPEHISAYCLTYEEDTDYFARFTKGEFGPDDERDASYFEIAGELLAASGYERYEISNFSRPGHECRHNYAYWQGANYLGLGPSAFSTVEGSRWQNIADTSEYTRRISAGEDPAAFRESLDTDTRRREQIAFSLRTSRGVDLALLSGAASDMENLQELVTLGLIATSNARCTLTPQGLLLADEIAARFV